MSDKAAKKKQFILDTAKTIFSKKGFKNVTMKDIVEACEISRGGLYIYFDSTEAIFEEIMSQKTSDFESLFASNSDELSAGDKLALLLNEKKKEILAKQDDLSVALYEYLFMKYSMGNPAENEKAKFDATYELIAKLIEEGAASGEFYSEDHYETARNIVFALEGMKVTSKTFGLTEKDVDMELLYLLGGIIAED